LYATTDRAPVGARVAIGVGLAVVAGVLFVVIHSMTSIGRVYSVAQVQAGLRHSPQLWAGRTVLVYGVAIGCPPGYPCPQLNLPAGTAETGLGLASSTRVPLAQALPLECEPQDSWLMVLRHVPVLRHLVPPPQALYMARLADHRVYRVRLVSVTPCGTPSSLCIRARLLDAGQIPQVY
jgi:hypothetical protein